MRYQDIFKPNQNDMIAQRFKSSSAKIIGSSLFQTFAILFIFQHTMGQHVYEQGYVINNSGDTISGFINVLDGTPDKVKIKITDVDDRTRYIIYSFPDITTYYAYGLG